MKKLLVFIIIVFLLFIGCNDKTESIKNNFFASSFVRDTNIGYLLDFTLFENELAILGCKSDTGFSELRTKIITFDLNGNMLTEVELMLKDGSYHNGISGCIDSDGKVWVLFNTGVMGKDEYALVCYEPNGSITEKISVDYDFFGEISISKTLFVNSRAETNNAYFYFIFDNKIIMFDKAGKQIEPDGSDRNIKNICRLNDGRIMKVCLNTQDSETLTYSFSDLNPQPAGNENKYPDLKTERPFFFRSGNDEYDLLMCSSSYVYGYDLETGTRTELMDWIKNNINNTGADMYRNVIISEDSVFCLFYAPYTEGLGAYSSSGNISLVKLSATDIPHNEEKRIIKLSALYTDPMIKNTVTEFNSLDNDYYIELKTYSDKNLWVDNDAVVQFNMDIISGDIPDAVFLERTSPFRNYTSKGLFTDLYGLMDTDPEVKREDYLRNIFRLMETDGRLYVGTASFFVNALIGKTSDIGTQKSWTWDDYNKLLSEKPSGIIPITDTYTAMTKDYFLSILLRTAINKLVDYKNHTCSFINEEFYDMLKATEDIR